jgi:hypothetical protein
LTTIPSPVAAVRKLAKDTKGKTVDSKMIWGKMIVSLSNY